jgi:hypothetical protein
MIVGLLVYRGDVQQLSDASSGTGVRFLNATRIGDGTFLARHNINKCRLNNKTHVAAMRLPGRPFLRVPWA